LRKLTIFLCVLALTIPVLAQQRTGNIFGKVLDQEGNALPGASVTLTGSLTAPVSTVSSAEGNFRFLSLSPSANYALKVELQGFKTLTRPDIIVSIGKNTEISLTLEVGALEEEITVTAATPVVETKKTTITQTVTREVLQSLPTARDPWVILQQAAGVQVDRENVGGSESGQMSGFIARGGGTEIWSVDGVNTEDPSSISSITYYDFDTFEEMNITQGGGDVSVATGGIQVNLVTRRGGNKLNIGGRFYRTDKKFQGDNLTDALKKEGVVGTNVIRAIKDYGFNIGGPLIKDKIWWWASYGVQDIWTNNLYGAKDDTLLQNYAAKVNFQILPQNRFEAFLHVGGKEKFGRSAGYECPQGYHQLSKYYFGTPILKVEDEHMFGDSFLLSVKYAFSGGGFQFLPTVDEKFENWLTRDDTTGIYQNGWWNYGADRPTHSARILGNYFNDNLFGLSHEIKFGAEYRNSTGAHYSTAPGNTQRNTNLNYASMDINGDGEPDYVPGIERLGVWRGWKDNNNIKEYTGYLSDTITKGRFNLILGLRYSYMKPEIMAFTMSSVEKNHPAWQKNFSSAAADAIAKVLPGLTVPARTGDYKWAFLSPRIGMTYDLSGDGKTIVKLSAAQYGDWMGTGEASYYEPLGLGGWMDFYWRDTNGNRMVDVTELYWTTLTYAPNQVFDASGNLIGNVADNEGVMWGDYDITNPQAFSSPRYTIDKSVNSPRVQEILLSVEREVLPDLGVALDFSYRKFDKFNWTLPYDPTTGAKTDKSAYGQAGTIPGNMASYSGKDAAGKPYYLLKAGIPSRFYRIYEQQPDYYRDFMGAELRMTKRLSNKWMLDASFTYQNQKEHYGDNGYVNATNLWARDGLPWGRSMGASSGKINVNVFSRWLFKVSGLYQLPFDFNVSGSFNAREGHIILESMQITNYAAPNATNRSTTVDLTAYGTERLPVFYNLNMRLEKVLKAGDIGKIYIMADLFNVLNSSLMNRRYDRYHGTYYPTTGTVSKNATDYKANEVLNPRIVRLGVRFQF